MPEILPAHSSPADIILRFACLRVSEMMQCVVEITLMDEIIRHVKQRNPGADINTQELPVFKTCFVRIVQLAVEGQNLCRALPAFEGFRWHKDEDRTWYTQRFIETAGSDNALRELAHRPLDYLMSWLAEFRAKRLEIEQLAVQIRDCVEERDAILEPQWGNLAEQSVGQYGATILEKMALLKTYQDAIEEHLAELRR